MKRIVVILAAIFLTTAFTVEAQRGPGYGMMNGRGPGFGPNLDGRCFADLDLTEEQEEQIENLRTTHQQEMIDLRADLQKKRLMMRELWDEDNFSKVAYLDAVEEMNEAQNKIRMARANHKMEIYDILTDEQREEWLDHECMFQRRGGDGFGKGKGFHHRRGLRQ